MPSQPDQTLYVKKSGSDAYGDGKSWATAWETPQYALAQLAGYSANIEFGLGGWYGPITYTGEGQMIRGNRRFIYGTHFKAEHPTDNVVNCAWSQCGLFDVMLDGSDATWNAVALWLSHALFFAGERIIFRNSNDWATATTGGIGLYLEAMEEANFKNLQFSEFNKAIRLGIGATGSTFEQVHMDTCWQDLVIDPADMSAGGHVFTKMKGVGCKGPNPVFIEGGGQNTFIAVDFEESTVIGNEVKIESNKNTFINGGVAPQSNWIVNGDQNIFENLKILRRMIVNGDQNDIRSPQLIGEELTLNGTGNILRNIDRRAGTVTVNPGNFTESFDGGGSGGSGSPGPAPVLQIGNVTTVQSGGQATAGVRKVNDPATYALDFGLVKGDTGPQGPQGPAGSGGGGSSGSSSLAPGRSQGLILSDPLVPVTADGVGLGVAQAQGSPQKRFFLLTGNPKGVVGVLGSDVLPSYPANAGPLIKASPAVYMPGWGVWTPNGTADADQVYGMPGVSVISSRIDIAGRKRRLTQRWYKIPGVPDALFCELLLTVDPTSTDGAATQWPTAGSDGAAPYIPRFSLMFESKPGVGGLSIGADAALNGLIFVNNYVNTSGVDPIWYFVRCLTDPATGFYYEEAGTADPNQNFGSGALPGGASSYTTTGGRMFRAHLSATSQGLPMVFCVRYVVGIGYSPDAAKNVAKAAPNNGPDDTVQYYENQVAAAPRPASLSSDEARAWSYFMLNPAINMRTERDWQPEFAAWDGRPRRLPFNALGRWNALWPFDTTIGLLGHSELDSDLVRSCLDYFVNSCMNQSTGFLRRDPTTTTETSIGNFYLARALRRYLAATGDKAFATALYPKLKLLYTWWTVTAPSSYRHPSWPTIKLLTASVEHEVQEASPVTAGGNYPAGDDWLTAIAYDSCVHMAYLAGATGNSGDVGFWNNEAAAYKDALRTRCWDPGQGWFQPVMKPSSPSGGQADSLGRFQQVRTYRAFWHLWAGTATPAMAQTMRNQIMDSNIFLGTYGVRTVDKRWSGYDPNHWVQGGSRPYFDAAVSLGLRRYGFNSDADVVLQKWIDRQNTVGTTPEMTNPDNGTGGFARFLLTGCMLTEALLAKRAPTMLGIDSGTVTGIGTDLVTS